MYKEKLKLQPVRVLHKYPHMSAAEAEIWSEYIKQSGSDLLAVAYDVACGQCGSVKKGEDPALRRMWQRITSKRIDVVALRRGGFDIIEVKAFPDLKAPGQAAAYVPLLKDKINTTLPIRPVLLCRYPFRDLARLCRAFNVELIVLQP